MMLFIVRDVEYVGSNHEATQKERQLMTGVWKGKLGELTPHAADFIIYRIFSSLSHGKLPSSSAQASTRERRCGCARETCTDGSGSTCRMLTKQCSPAVTLHQVRETERSQSPLKSPFLEEQMSKRRLICHNDYSMCHTFTPLRISYWAILWLSVAQERLPGRGAVQPDLSTHSAALETHRASAFLRVPDVFLRLTDMRRRGKIRPTSC